MTWTRIDIEDDSTWPPEDTLVLVRELNSSTIGLRAMNRDVDYAGLRFAMYDEGNDYDDGTLGYEVAAGDTIAAWHPIPYPEPESADRHFEDEEA